MRKTINGKRYDTEKSTMIAEYDNGYFRTDFHWFAETLWRTPGGNYFLVGEGNGLSRYAESVGNMSASGLRFVPLSEEEALRWCEETDCEQAIDDYFSDLVSPA